MTRKPAPIRDGGITWAACERNGRYNENRLISIQGIREPADGASLDICGRILKWLPKAIAWRDEQPSAQLQVGEGDKRGSVPGSAGSGQGGRDNLSLEGWMPKGEVWTSQYRCRTRPRELAAFFRRGGMVNIHTREHGAWWRTGGHGYTLNREEAGIFTAQDAFDHSGHCGPEKGIYFVSVNTPPPGPSAPK